MTITDRPADDQDMRIIDEYIEYLRQTQCSEQTMDSRRRILGRLNHDMPFGLGRVSRDELAAWLYREGWSQNTQATYYRCLRSFYCWASDPADPWLSGNPTDTLARVRTADSVARPCDTEHLRRILTEAAEPYRRFAILAAYQGLRAIEISRLDREHVDEQRLFVVKGKGGRPRVHDTDPYVWRALRDLPAGPIARHPETGERATASYVAVRSRDYFWRNMKIKTSLHPMRHWLGVTVQREYKDIRVTQKILGHRQLSSTQIYTDATDEQQREARSRLPRLGE